MTRFPLIKGQCCQKPDRNFPAMQCSRITQRSWCAGLSWMEQWTGTIKSDICFCDRVLHNLLNKMSRVYVRMCGGKKKSLTLLFRKELRWNSGWVMGVFDLAEPKDSHFLGFSIEILNKECFNVKTSCTRLFPLSTPHPSPPPQNSSNLLFMPFQLNGCKSSVYPNWVPLKPQPADWSTLLAFTQATCRVRRLHSRYATSSTGFEALLFSGTLSSSAIKWRPQKIQRSGRKKKPCMREGGGKKHYSLVKFCKPQHTRYGL